LNIASSTPPEKAGRAESIPVRDSAHFTMFLPFGKVGGLQILRCKAFAEDDDGFTLWAAALNPSDFCYVGVIPGAGFDDLMPRPHCLVKKRDSGRGRGSFNFIKVSSLKYFCCHQQIFV
jgi:hypothetical protein